MNNNRFDHLFEQAARDNEQAYNRAVQDAMEARMKHMQIEHLRREQQRQEILHSDPDLLAAFHQVKRQRQAAAAVHQQQQQQVPRYGAHPVPHPVMGGVGFPGAATSLDPLGRRTAMTGTDPLLQRGDPTTTLPLGIQQSSMHASAASSLQHHSPTLSRQMMDPTMHSLASIRETPSLTLEQTRALVRQSSVNPGLTSTAIPSPPLTFPLPSMHQRFQGLDRKISAASATSYPALGGGVPSTSRSNSMDKSSLSMNSTFTAAPTKTEASLPTLASPKVSRKRKQRTSSAGSSAASSQQQEQSQGVGHRNDAQWMEHFEALKQYKEEHGNCVVPRGYDQNPALATWVAEQRKQYHRRLKPRQGLKKSTLNEHRLKLLQSLDFEWNAQEAAWSRHLTNLLKFKAIYGHVHVPLNYQKDPKLGLWVKEQRRHYGLLNQGRTSHMTADRIRILENHGFMWDTQEATWRGRLEQLKRFRDRFGHCEVPVEWEEDPSLYHWVCFQCKQYRKVVNGRETNLTPVRIRMLSEIGFTWPTVYGKRTSVSDSVAASCNDIEDDEDDDKEVAANSSDDKTSSEQASAKQADEVAEPQTPPEKETSEKSSDKEEDDDDKESTPKAESAAKTAEDDDRTVSEDEASYHSAVLESPESLV